MSTMLHPYILLVFSSADYNSEYPRERARGAYDSGQMRVGLGGATREQSSAILGFGERTSRLSFWKSNLRRRYSAGRGRLAAIEE